MGWYKLLQSYTSRHITDPSDILVGLSGLASEVHNVIGPRHLAGIWDGYPNTFIRGLSWRVSDEAVGRMDDPS
jgi:hypothetical protein